MRLALSIAFRYLFAKKSHNVINIISAISAAGMAVGTAALIIILSVYNGFDKIVEDSFSDVEPDILVRPATGKFFIPEEAPFEKVMHDKRVLNISSVLEDNVLCSYDGRQAVAIVKGVDEVYEEESPFQDKVIEGEWELRRIELKKAAVGVGLAYKLGLSPHFRPHLEFYYPDREGNIDMANPMSSVESISMRPSSVFSINQEVDQNLVIIPLESMRELLGFEEEISAVEIRLVPGTSKKETARIVASLQKALGEDFAVLDRYMQNPSIYRMMRFEKLAIFLILAFITIIIAFNVYSSLSMLVIEKKGDIATLRSLGAPDAMIHRIFVFEGWLITLLGMALGLVVGIIVVLIQMKTGLIKMPGNYVIQAYPAILKFSDILITAASVAIIGYITALIPASKTSRI